MTRNVRRRNSRRRRSGGNPRSSPDSGIHSDVISNTDPFHASAQGAKLFDSVAGHSVPFQCRQVTTLSTDANGLGAINLTPLLQAAYRLDATWTANQVTTWGTPTVYPEAVSTITAGRYRIVNFGVRILGTVAPINASGVVTIFSQAEFVPNGFDVGSSLAEQVTRVPLHSLDHQWVSKPTGSESRLHDVSAADYGQIDWTTCTVAVLGGPASTSVITVECVLNIEFLPEPSSALTRIATPAAPHDIGRQMAIANVHRALPHVHHQSESIAAKVMHMLGNYVGAKALQTGMRYAGFLAPPAFRPAALAGGKFISNWSAIKDVD